MGTATDTIAYTYDSAWKDRLASYDGETILCDPLGNPLSYTQDRDFEWFGRSMYCATLDAGDTFVEYNYDINGLRNTKHIYDDDHPDDPLTFHYFWSDDNRLLGYTYEQPGTQADDYSVIVLYNTAKEPIGFTVDNETDCETYYYLKNIQGDVLCVTDITGTPLVNYTYDAWGAFTMAPASQQVSNTDLLYVSMLNPVTYRGYFYDLELGLYYLQSRYYDPETGRFLSADAYADTGIGIIGSNAFAYCNNNAIQFIDPDGFHAIANSFTIGFQNDPDLLWDIKDQYYFNSRAKRTLKDKSMWVLSAAAAATMRPFFPNGIRFYTHFRTGKGKTLYYNYQDVMDSDKQVSDTVGSAYVDLLYFVEKQYSEGRLKSNNYVCLSGYLVVNPSSKDWQFALGSHRVWMRAFFKYIASTNKMQISIHISAQDRYNFDKGLSGMIGVLSNWNGRFVEVGYAKHFDSIGTLDDTYQWTRGTFV